MAKNSHLTLQDRSIIESSLTQRHPFIVIAEQVGKDPSTIAKEIRKHAEEVKTGSCGQGFNPCVYRFTCKKTFICGTCTSGGRRCALCSRCHHVCSDFEEYECPKLKSPPYVCNGCKDRKRCTLLKREYVAVNAQSAYEKERSESRSGIAADSVEIERINELISPLLKSGQSIHHVCVNNTDEIMLSERTIYNYVKGGLFTAGPLDLPRMVRMRPRKSEEIKKVDRNYLQDRSYADFQKYIAENPDLPVVEMDSVIGRKGGKVLLTMFFRNSNMLLAFLRDSNTARSVSDTMNRLHQKLGDDTYKKLFPVILADRGSEFTNPIAVECDANGEIRSRMFYCDPSSPYQKGGIEVAHEMIRRVIPKGTSFDDLTQADIDLMLSHINSYKREKLNNRSAHQMFSFLYGKDILDALNIQEIAPNEINLKPKLMKK